MGRAEGRRRCRPMEGREGARAVKRATSSPHCISPLPPSAPEPTPPLLPAIRPRPAREAAAARNLRLNRCHRGSSSRASESSPVCEDPAEDLFCF
eukprot:scaffold5545_cov111-Isochrysis_galbana.AAC.9